MRVNDQVRLILVGYFVALHSLGLKYFLREVKDTKERKSRGKEKAIISDGLSSLAPLTLQSCNILNITLKI